MSEKCKIITDDKSIFRVEVVQRNVTLIKRIAYEEKNINHNVCVGYNSRIQLDHWFEAHEPIN